MLRTSTGAGALALATLLTLAAQAFAADLPSRLEPAPPVAPSKSYLAAPSTLWPTWTGFYAGLTTGYDLWRKHDVKPNGFQIGVRAGYDYQITQDLVFGALVEGDLNFGKNTIETGVAAIRTRHLYTASADARLGYAINSSNLAYAMVGYTRVELEEKLVDGVAGDLGRSGRNGMNVGVGYEYRFVDNLSAFAEARYHHMAIWGARPGFIDLKLGVNYRL